MEHFIHEESNGLTYSLGQLSLAESPPVAAIVGTVQPNIRPGGGAQDGTVRAQCQGLDPPWALVVVDGLSTCLCAPQVHTAYTHDSETQSLNTLIMALIYRESTFWSFDHLKPKNFLKIY